MIRRSANRTLRQNSTGYRMQASGLGRTGLPVDDGSHVMMGDLRLRSGRLRAPRSLNAPRSGCAARRLNRPGNLIHELLPRNWRASNVVHTGTRARS